MDSTTAPAEQPPVNVSEDLIERIDALSSYTRALAAEQRAAALERQLANVRAAHGKFVETLGMHDPRLPIDLAPQFDELADAIGPGPEVLEVQGEFAVGDLLPMADGSVTAVLELVNVGPPELFANASECGVFGLPSLRPEVAEHIKIGERFQFTLSNK